MNIRQIEKKLEAMEEKHMPQVEKNAIVIDCDEGADFEVIKAQAKIDYPGRLVIVTQHVSVQYVKNIPAYNR